MSCTQKRQLVRFPKVRILKQWFRHFNDHKEFHNEGNLHLFSLMALFSYANFRSNERVINGVRYMESPGQWVCKLYNCDPFNFGEVTIAPSGKLEIFLIQLVPLTDAAQQSEADEDLEAEDILDRSDVKKWYTTTGVVLLSELIDELNVQGHKKLKIKENGDVYIVAGGTQQVVETIPDFPPRLAWEDLCIMAREDEIHAEVCDQELAVSWS